MPVKNTGGADALERAEREEEENGMGGKGQNVMVPRGM